MLRTTRCSSAKQCLAHHPNTASMLTHSCKLYNEASPTCHPPAHPVQRLQLYAFQKGSASQPVDQVVGTHLPDMPVVLHHHCHQLKLHREHTLNIICTVFLLNSIGGFKLSSLRLCLPVSQCAMHKFMAAHPEQPASLNMTSKYLNADVHSSQKC